MSKPLRTDAKKNTKKVVSAVIKKPLATSREIAKETGLSKSTVNNKLAEVGQTEKIDRTSTVVAIEETDLQIVSLAQSINLRWMEDLSSADKITREDARTADQISSTSQKRYSFLSGENANDQGGEKKIELEIVRN